MFAGQRAERGADRREDNHKKRESVFLAVLQVVWAIFSLLVWGSLAALAIAADGHGSAGFLRRMFSRRAERARLGLAATLLDLGHHFMLCEEERRARRLAGKLSGWRARSSGLKAAALGAGARRIDEATLEAPIGSREQEGNPSRTIELSLVVHQPPHEDEGRPRLDDAPDEPHALTWRVLNRPSDGYRGVSVTVEIPSLERALLSYHARPLLSPERGGRFFDESVFEESVQWPDRFS